MVRQREATFQASDGLQLFERSWRPDGDPIATVVIVHGYAEHCGRYGHVAERLVNSGHAVYAFDLRGHGRSEGRRVFARSLDEHVADLRHYVARIRELERGTALFLLGHSMGGTIVASFLMSDASGVSGAILSGAALRSRRGLSRVPQAIFSGLGRLAPRLPLATLSSANISRNEAVVTSYDNDPLVYRGRMPAGTVSALIGAIREIEAGMERITLPLLLLHGTLDALTEPDGSRELYERAGSQDKKLKLYEGFYHEILNEPEKRIVLDDIVAWLEKRTAG